MIKSADILLFPRKPKAQDEFSRGINLTEIYEYFDVLRNQLCLPKQGPTKRAKIRKTTHPAIKSDTVETSSDHGEHTVTAD